MLFPSILSSAEKSSGNEVVLPSPLPWLLSALPAKSRTSLVLLLLLFHFSFSIYLRNFWIARSLKSTFQNKQNQNSRRGKSLFWLKVFSIKTLELLTSFFLREQILALPHAKPLVGKRTFSWNLVTVWRLYISRRIHSRACCLGICLDSYTSVISDSDIWSGYLHQTQSMTALLFSDWPLPYKVQEI